MPWFTKASYEKCKARASSTTDRNPTCNECGLQFMFEGTGRSIHIDGMMGGLGEVRNVATLYCPVCDGKPRTPSYGTPIYESEIIHIDLWQTKT